MTLREPEPDDAPAILAIAYSWGLPWGWKWPEGRYGLVAASGRVVAFVLFAETIYGLVVEELWPERSREGERGLALLSHRIEAIAQGLANQRGEPLAVGGIVRRDRERHRAALEKRGYSEAAAVMEKVFKPQRVC